MRKGVHRLHMRKEALVTSIKLLLLFSDPETSIFNAEDYMHESNTHTCDLRSLTIMSVPLRASTLAQESPLCSTQHIECASCCITAA